jgi:hypothetical protein
MHARVITAPVRPGKLDEAIQVFRDSVLPAAGQQAEAKQVIVLADRDASQCLVVALWESEEALVASDRSGYFAQQLAKFIGLFSAPPRTDTYEVAVSVARP